MDKLKTILVTFVWLVCFSLFGQNGGIMQIVRTSDQIGFLLEGQNSNGFFTDAYILDLKEKGKKTSSEATIENVEYLNHKLNDTTFEISYINSKLEKKKETYAIAIGKEKNSIRLKHETGRLFLRDALSKAKDKLSKKKDILARMIGKVTPTAGRSCSCSYNGNTCRVSCPKGTYAVCICDDDSSSCFCSNVSPPVISPNESEEEITSEDLPALANDPLRIAVAPTLVHSSVNFAVKEGGNITYYIEIFNMRGNKVIAKQILPERLNLLDQPKGIYFYTITSEDGYIQKGKIMKI